VGEVDYWHGRQPSAQDTVERADETVRETEIAQEADHRWPLTFRHHRQFFTWRVLFAPVSRLAAAPG
jgi:hypothetical protein